MPDFAFVILPDTQTLADTAPATLLNIGNWIVNNQSTYNIRAVLHIGDHVETVGDAAEWANAEAMYALLDGANIPYLMGHGNHDDYDILRNGTFTNFDTHFPQGRYTGKSWWNGGFYGATAANAYLIVGDYLFITCEFGPRQVALNWVNSILAANPTKKVIFFTHCLEYNTGPRFTTTGDDFNPHDYYGSDTHDGQEIWDEIKANDNLKLCFSGHHYTGDSASRHTATTDGGKTVESMCANWQGELPATGKFRLALVYGSTVHIRTWDALNNRWQADANNDFWLTLAS